MHSGMGRDVCWKHHIVAVQPKWCRNGKELQKIVQPLRWGDFTLESLRDLSTVVMSGICAHYHGKVADDRVHMVASSTSLRLNKFRTSGVAGHKPEIQPQP